MPCVQSNPGGHADGLRIEGVDVDICIITNPVFYDWTWLEIQAFIGKIWYNRIELVFGHMAADIHQLKRIFLWIPGLIELGNLKL